MAYAVRYNHSCPLLIGLLILFLSLLESRSCEAQPSAVSNKRPVLEALRVQANDCFDTTTLAAHVELWLKRSSVDRHVELEVRGDPRGPAGVTIEIRRDERSVGTRFFPAFTVPCEDIRTAIAMSAALAIDATEHESQQVEPATRKPPANPHLPLQWTPPPAVATSLEGVALTGVLPTWAVGFAPGVAFSVVPSVAVRVGLLVTSTSSFALGGGSVNTSAIAGRLDACAVVLADVLRLRACTGAIAGRLNAEGANFADAGSSGVQRHAFVGGLARLDLRLPITGVVGFLVAADIFLRFTNSDIRVEGGESRPMAPVGAMFGGGPELRFW
jgi:hypothetical protein